MGRAGTNRIINQDRYDRQHLPSVFGEHMGCERVLFLARWAAPFLLSMAPNGNVSVFPLQAPGDGFVSLFLVPGIRHRSPFPQRMLTIALGFNRLIAAKWYLIMQIIFMRNNNFKLFVLFHSFTPDLFEHTSTQTYCSITETVSFALIAPNLMT